MRGYRRRACIEDARIFWRENARIVGGPKKKP
jgi:hypothetical protein